MTAGAGAGARVLVLNGGSSSGKSTLARALQELLPGLWLTFGTDDLIEALPGRGDSPKSGISAEPGGAVVVDDVFRLAEAAWYAGLAAMAHAGARLIIDEVFLSGGAGQDRVRGALDGIEPVWIGVHCDARAAAAREETRADRVAGMAVRQAGSVHAGMNYDIEVDTTERSAEACAREIAERLGHRAAAA